jgi:hypothetical protein
MGMFNIFKRKTQEEKNIIFLQKLRNKIIIHESSTIMHDMIIAGKYDHSYLDENPSGKGEFGLEVSNPIPIYGVENIPAYMDKLRYEYTGSSGTTIGCEIDFVRTTDADQSSVGSKKPTTKPSASSTSSPNINGHIDVYNLYSIDGEKLAKIYVNCYSLKTSDKVPDGFIHRDKVPAEKDSKVTIEALKHLKK